MNGMKDIKIIIWGADDSNVLGLLRQLKDYKDNIFIVFQGRKCRIASISKYCGKHIFIKDYDTTIQYLIRNFSALEEKPFLISSTDLVAEAIDQNSAILAKYFVLMGTKKPLVLTQILNKYEMGKLAVEVGFVVPTTKFLRPNSQIVGIKYPCLIKPYKNDKNIKKTFKTNICENETELVDVLKSVDSNSMFVAQDYIHKEYDILIYGCRFFSGEIIAPGYFKKDRWYKKADGSHGYLINGIPSLVDFSCIERFLSRIDYYGLFSFEFGVKNNIAYFYEVNLRNDGTSHYFYQAGVNLPRLWIEQFSNLLRKNIYLNDCEFIDEINDEMNIADGFVEKTAWIEQRNQAKSFRYFDKNDILPYYYQLFQKRMKKLLMPIKPLLLKLFK